MAFDINFFKVSKWDVISFVYEGEWKKFIMGVLSKPEAVRNIYNWREGCEVVKRYSWKPSFMDTLYNMLGEDPKCVDFFKLMDIAKDLKDPSQTLIDFVFDELVCVVPLGELCEGLQESGYVISKLFGKEVFKTMLECKFGNHVKITEFDMDSYCLSFSVYAQKDKVVKAFFGKNKLAKVIFKKPKIVSSFSPRQIIHILHEHVCVKEPLLQSYIKLARRISDLRESDIPYDIYETFFKLPSYRKVMILEEYPQLIDLIDKHDLTKQIKKTLKVEIKFNY